MMKSTSTYVVQLKRDLKPISSPQKAAASQRFFPHKVALVGASAVDIQTLIRRFHTENKELDCTDALHISELLLTSATYSEEKLLAFGLINKWVKHHYKDGLLNRFEYWLKHYADNWALVDDLCIKTIYNFFLGRPYLIESIKHWAHSPVPWCRRASNVAWVKFVNRKIGKSTYRLDKRLIFQNCDTLLTDTDEYVQKSVGWLLKVSAAEYEKDVLRYLQVNGINMPRSTIRYALEKIDPVTRQHLLSAIGE
ncbi:MAG TPA: DNA alkylation repair protein [Cellvibrionaceae bacterium]